MELALAVGVEFLDLAPLFEGGMGTVAGHQAVVEAKQDQVDAVGLGRLVDGESERAVGREAGRVVGKPVFIGRAAGIEQNDAMGQGGATTRPLIVTVLSAALKTG